MKKIRALWAFLMVMVMSVFAQAQDAVANFATMANPFNFAYNSGGGNGLDFGGVPTNPISGGQNDDTRFSIGEQRGDTFFTAIDGSSSGGLGANRFTSSAAMSYNHEDESGAGEENEETDENNDGNPQDN